MLEAVGVSTMAIDVANRLPLAGLQRYALQEWVRPIAHCAPMTSRAAINACAENGHLCQVGLGTTPDINAWTVAPTLSFYMDLRVHPPADFCT